MKKIFSFWRLVISIAWAQSLTWGLTTEKETRTMLFGFNIIERDTSKAAEFIIGPLAVVVGFVR